MKYILDLFKELQNIEESSPWYLVVVNLRQVPLWRFIIAVPFTLFFLCLFVAFRCLHTIWEYWHFKISSSILGFTRKLINTTSMGKMNLKLLGLKEKDFDKYAADYEQNWKQNNENKEL
jgi:hypothetical protein